MIDEIRALLALQIAGHLPAAYRRLVEGLLGSRPPAEPQVVALCHNDLGTSAVTGVIDWADAAIADPARDLAPRSSSGRLITTLIPSTRPDAGGRSSTPAVSSSKTWRTA